MLPEPVPQSWRGLLRLSVRGAVVVVAAIGALLGWTVHQARVQRDAVAAIKGAGGEVAYGWEWSDGKAIKQGRPWAPRFLVDLVGLDYFEHVTAATIDGETDAVIAQVERLTQVQRLSFIGSSISGAGLAHLKDLHSLASLSLGSSPLTYAGVRQLRGLRKLRMLVFNRRRITDDEIEDLRRALPNVNFNYIDFVDPEGKADAPNFSVEIGGLQVGRPPGKRQGAR